MRKHKIDFKKYRDAHEEVEVKGKDGTVVKVRTHIPYEEKVRMAQEMIEEGLMIHDDSMCYESYMIEAIRMLKVFQYYTDVKTDGAEPEDVADFAINNEIWGAVKDAVKDDLLNLNDVYYTMIDGVIETYKDDRCLTKALRRSFSFLFTGEDITETLAKAEAARDTIYDAVNALREKEREEQSKVNDGKLMLGDNIINFSKRE